MKINELTTVQLDYWVAKAQGWTQDTLWGKWKPAEYHPTTNWQQVGELIEKFKIMLIYQVQIKKWVAQFSEDVPTMNYADDPKVAVCMAVIASVFGDEVSDE